MGAYGGTSKAGKSGNIADFDIDGKVDFLDFAQLAKLWNKDTTGFENLNGDDKVDIYDLDVFCIEWLKQD